MDEMTVKIHNSYGYPYFSKQIQSKTQLAKQITNTRNYIIIRSHPATPINVIQVLIQPFTHYLKDKYGKKEL